jgi:hypothetical protein
MDANALLEDLASRGFAVGVREKQVVVSPARLLTDADREAIRRNRDAVVKLLTAEPPPPLEWLRGYLGRDVVPADTVLQAGRDAGYSMNTIKQLAKVWLCEQRGMDGRVYWSRPWSPSDVNALFAKWRQFHADNEARQ